MAFPLQERFIPHLNSVLSISALGLSPSLGQTVIELSICEPIKSLAIFFLPWESYYTNNQCEL